MEVHLSKSRFRAVGTVVATLFIVSLSFAGCSTGGSVSACAPGSGLTTTTGLAGTKLPPSHDNDVGRGRIPDLTPDADIDANQRTPVCSHPK